MFDFDGRKKKASVIALQLAPMIDIFTLVIVFLLKGTVLSETVISNPESVQLAKSDSQETTELAAEVYIKPDHVEFKMINENVPLQVFQNEVLDLNDQMLIKLKKFIDDNGKIAGNTLKQVNVVADYKTNYKTIFHVVRMLRLAGFQAMLFIAEGEQS